MLDEDYEPELCRHQTSRNEYFDAKLTKSFDKQPDSESGKVVHPELPCPQISEAAASSSLCESSSSAMGKETDSIADKNDEESHLERPPPSVQIVSESSSDRSHSQQTDSLVLDSEKEKPQTENETDADLSHLENPPASVVILSEKGVERPLSTAEDLSHLDRPPPSVQILCEKNLQACRSPVAVDYLDEMPPTPAVSPPRSDLDIPLFPAEYPEVPDVFEDHRGQSSGHLQPPASVRLPTPSRSSHRYRYPQQQSRQMPQSCQTNQNFTPMIRPPFRPQNLFQPSQDAFNQQNQQQYMRRPPYEQVGPRIMPRGQFFQPGPQFFPYQQRHSYQQQQQQPQQQQQLQQQQQQLHQQQLRQQGQSHQSYRTQSQTIGHANLRPIAPKPHGLLQTSMTGNHGSQISPPSFIPGYQGPYYPPQNSMPGSHGAQVPPPNSLSGIHGPQVQHQNSMPGNHRPHVPHQSSVHGTHGPRFPAPNSQGNNHGSPSRMIGPGATLTNLGALRAASSYQSPLARVPPLQQRAEIPPNRCVTPQSAGL